MVATLGLSFCILNSQRVSREEGQPPGTRALGRGLAHSPGARGWSGGAEAEAAAKGACASWEGGPSRAPGREGQRDRLGERSVAAADVPETCT